MAEFVESQGTEIYFIDPASPTAAVVMDCPTSVSKSGGARNTIEIMCLNATDPEYRSGTRTATTYSVPFALIPTSVNHQRLFDFQESGELIPFLIALSDGTTDPTVASGALVPPTDRSSFSFEALVTDVAIDIQTNDVVRGTLTLQVSGPTTTTWKVAP